MPPLGKYGIIDATASFPPPAHEDLASAFSFYDPDLDPTGDIGRSFATALVEAIVEALSPGA